MLRGFATGESRVHQADVAALFEGARVLALGAPPCALPASTCWLRLDDEAGLRDALAALFAAGVEIDWTPLDARRHRVVRDFPRRPFARQSFRSPRIDAALAGADADSEASRERDGEPAIHPLVRDRLAQPDGRVSCRLRTATAWLDFIDGHRVQGHRLLPAPLRLKLMRAVAATTRRPANRCLPAGQRRHARGRREVFLLAGVGEVALPPAEALRGPVRQTCDEGYRFTSRPSSASLIPCVSPRSAACNRHGRRTEDPESVFDYALD
ncbi:hypothetical protein DF052_02680 [Burkholderia glumae]|uniref:hypothetical protein n=1 Tax=Burkholderia glumae TaxID=337 RepID=UPI000F5FF1CA|nr:hypothetical protein [Burkholderia glumae]RQZ76079.1 hypothetical protein DF052_02680 [Burkholderia glumae]